MGSSFGEGDLGTIVVWFSCGAASAVALQKTIEVYGQLATVRAANNYIKEEDEDNRRFLRDVESWLGVTVEQPMNPKYPSCSVVEVWEDRKFMSGPRGAPCTLELKKAARAHWEANNHFDWLVMGFTAEEKKRAEWFMLGERSNLLTPLIDEGITKQDCYDIVRAAGIKVPRMYELGYPNANCPGCVKATSPTYWNHVRRVHPKVFEDRARQSRRLGARLVRVKNKRIFLDELDPNAVGAPMKNTDTECGIFCEEKPF